MLNKHHSLGTPRPQLPCSSSLGTPAPWSPSPLQGLLDLASVPVPQWCLDTLSAASVEMLLESKQVLAWSHWRDPKGGLPLEATFASVLPPGTLVPVLWSWALASALPYGAVSSGGPPGASTGRPPRWHLVQAGPGEEPFSVERCAECTGASLPWTLLPSQ